MTQPTKQVVFQHIVLEGSAYEVGKQQGEIVKQIPPLKAWFCSGAGKLSEAELAGIRKQADAFCPGLNDEIQGCADSLGVPFGQIVYYLETYLHVNHCSHFAVLPSITTNHHLLIGRNYDFGDTMDDLSFTTTRVAGKPAHMGSPGLWFGRNDGINEHGFVVTMSTGGIPVGKNPPMTPPIQTGFMFWALMRTLLDQCRTVDDALTLIDRFPCCGNPILILADRQGHTTAVEIWGARHSVKRINATSADQFLCATNHFTIPEMIPYAPYIPKHSQVRTEAITKRLRQAIPNVSTETIQAILADPYPNGVCIHYYEEFFGTLHAIVFDATAGTAEVCFGSPHVNAWQHFDLHQSVAPGSYSATLPLEHPTSDFWERIPLN